jgi:transposase
MNTPLVIDERDPKWELLSKILGIVRSRRVKKEMAKEGVKPVNMAGTIFKIVFMSMFFSVEISYVVEELNRRKELRRFANIGKIPEAKAIYRFLSRFDEKQFVYLVSGVLSSICLKRGRNKTILIDSTDISLDLNWFKRRIKKEDLEEREFKWGYSVSKGYYIGYKLTLAIEYPSLRPIALLIHQGSPNDAKIYEEILEELKRRRIARNGDTVVFDRGYYGYKNYSIGISRFKIVPLIFPKKNFKMNKLTGIISYPLSIFGKSDLEKNKRFFNQLMESLRIKLKNWEEYKPIRSIIEDMFKLAKNAFSLKKLHRYTERSVKKFVCLDVLLIGIVVSLGIDSKEDLQRLAEC